MSLTRSAVGHLDGIRRCPPNGWWITRAFAEYTGDEIKLPMSLRLFCLMAVRAFAASWPSLPLDKVLVFSATAGFRHDSITNGITAIQALGATNGFTVDDTEDATTFSDVNLAQYKAVIFLSTTGDVLTNAAQENALQNFIRAGGGWVGGGSGG